MRRLAAATLSEWSGISLPSYNREEVSNGILHLGIGNFHRAHQAVYTDDILSLDPRWGIAGASLFSTTTRNRLKPQDWYYTICERSADTSVHRVIGAVKDILCLSDQRGELASAIAAPETKIISLTVTEKGYCHTIEGSLDSNHPDIQHDLAHPEASRSMPGVLIAGLKARMSAGSGPVSLVSCDNLSGNGKVLRKVILDFASQVDRGLVAWCEDNVRFPETMVDRIVPQPVEEDRDVFRQLTGLEDEGLIVCEPFRQWVIEDNFATERPPWEEAGAEIVADVGQFETAKLRMLNATHSALAYLGLLCGCEYIHETMADETLAAFADYLLTREVIPVIDVPPSMDVDAYKQSVLERFANSSIAYGTAQVATDGSMKLPQRIFPTMMSALEKNSGTKGLSLVAAAWVRCMTDENLSARFSDPASGSSGVNELLTAASAGEETATLAAETFSSLGDDVRETVKAVIAGP